MSVLKPTLTSVLQGVITITVVDVDEVAALFDELLNVSCSVVYETILLNSF